MAKVIAVYNKKGGCGKTTTATTLAYLLARRGKRTALIDLDSQGDSSLAYGVPNPDKLQTTILSLVKQVIIGEPLPSPSSYMYSYHGVDLVPSNEEISTLERNLSNVDFREYILKEYISQISPGYDYIIIDCMPNFDTSMLNVMVCADSVVIPTQAEYYSAIGSMKFIRNFQQIRQHANPKLEIAGILITMNQGNTNLSTQITQELERTIGNQIRIFNTRIPRSVKVAEASGYVKHFTLERYSSLYELRAKSKTLVRIIFTMTPDGDVLFLTPFVKQHRRDTMQALESSLSLLDRMRDGSCSYQELSIEFFVNGGKTK